MFVWSGSAWTEISSSAEIIAYKYTVAGGATSVSGADDNGLTLTYTVGKEQVYINGVLQVRGSDYTASTGSSITGISAMIASDIVTVLAFTSFSVSDTYTQAQADAKFFQTANAFLAGKNKIINGDFYVNQRGFSSGNADNSFNFDRWQANASGGTVTTTASTFTLGAAPVAGYEGRNFLTVATSGQTTSAQLTLVNQKIESVRNFANQTVTVSFWAKANTGTPKIAVEFQQNFGTGGSPSSTINTYAGQATLSTSWARYSVSVAVPSISGKTLGTNNNDFLNLILWYSAGSDYNARTGSLGLQNATIDIWGIQAEAGSIATPFQTATGTIQGELAACQRYLPAIAASNGEIYAGQAYSTTAALIPVVFPVTARVAPTGITVNSAGNFRLRNATATKVTTTAINFSTGTVSGSTIEGIVASGLVAGNATNLFNESSGTILFTGCEL
jgi:hypothetical protein